MVDLPTPDQSPISRANAYPVDVELITREGDAVATVKIPRFFVMPAMLQWGSRFFYADTPHANTEARPSRYREGLVWVVQ